MCVEIYVLPEKRIISTIAQLSDFLRGDDELLVIEDDYPPLAELRDGCLCPVDVRATFAPTPYILSQGENLRS